MMNFVKASSLLLFSFLIFGCSGSNSMTVGKGEKSTFSQESESKVEKEKPSQSLEIKPTENLIKKSNKFEELKKLEK